MRSFAHRGNEKLNRARIEAGFASEDDKDAEMEFWSENHYIMFASSEYLAGQLWEADQFQPGRSSSRKASKAGLLSGLQRKERGLRARAEVAQQPADVRLDGVQLVRLLPRASLGPS